MSELNKLNEQLNEQNMPQGWKDVQISPDMSLSMLVGFLNVLNQRLVSVENLIKVPTENGEMSLTELYVLQSKEELEKLKAQVEEKGE